MGKASRTTRLPLDLSARREGGADTSKQAYLEETIKILDEACAFYLAFFLAHADKLIERVKSFSEQHQEERKWLISPNELLTWANYPVKCSRYFEQHRTEPGWEQQRPGQILRKNEAELHFSQT